MEPHPQLIDLFYDHPPTVVAPMFEDHNDTVYEVIKSASLLNDAQLDELNESHLHTGKSLADAVADSGVVERGAILEAIANYLGYDYLAEFPKVVPEHIASAVRSSVARMYAVVPHEVDDTSISLLAKDPFNPAIIDDLTFTLNKDITIIVCNPGRIDELIDTTAKKILPSTIWETSVRPSKRQKTTSPRASH